ncbi:MAG: hypothetical protein ACJATS_000364 [Psychroserpens sp.]|jgi:hypothetical protein
MRLLAFQIFFLLTVGNAFGQADTIYSPFLAPVIGSCATVVLNRFDLTFRYGNVELLERNFKTLRVLSETHAEDVYELLMEDFKCSRRWRQYLKSLTGRKSARLPK